MEGLRGVVAWQFEVFCHIEEHVAQCRRCEYMKDTGGKSRATHTHIGIGAEINESAASQRQTSGCGTASSTLRPRKWNPPAGWPGAAGFLCVGNVCCKSQHGVCH